MLVLILFKNELVMRNKRFLDIIPHKFIFRVIAIMVSNSFKNYLTTLINFFNKNNIGYIIILNIYIFFLLLFTFLIFTVITKQIFSIINGVKIQRLDIVTK